MRLSKTWQPVSLNTLQFLGVQKHASSDMDNPHLAYGCVLAKCPMRDAAQKFCSLRE